MNFLNQANSSCFKAYDLCMAHIQAEHYCCHWAPSNKLQVGKPVKFGIAKIYLTEYAELCTGMKQKKSQTKILKLE